MCSMQNHVQNICLIMSDGKTRPPGTATLLSWAKGGGGKGAERGGPEGGRATLRPKSLPYHDRWHEQTSRHCNAAGKGHQHEVERTEDPQRSRSKVTRRSCITDRVVLSAFCPPLYAEDMPYCVPWHRHERGGEIIVLSCSGDSRGVGIFGMWGGGRMRGVAGGMPHSRSVCCDAMVCKPCASQCKSC